MLISKLFAEGDSFFKYPFKVIYHIGQSKEGSPVQLLVSVSKRNYKKAVDRNLIKRRVRESYRRNKEILFSSPRFVPDKTLYLVLIYTGKTILDSHEIERKIILILQRLIQGDAENNR